MKNKNLSNETTALTVAAKMPTIQGKTPGERINYLHRLSIETGKISIAAAIYAGWELTKVKQSAPFGSWISWLGANTILSEPTARRYMGVYAATIGAARASAEEPIALEVQPSGEELCEASANVEAKSLTGLYSQLKLLKRPEGHGGKREGAGRKPKKEDVAAKLDEVLESEVATWAIVKAAIDELVRADVEEKLQRLSDVHLAEMIQELNRIVVAAQDIISLRMDGEVIL